MRNSSHCKQQSDDEPWEELMSSFMLVAGQNFEAFEGQVGMGVRTQRLQSACVLLRTSGTQGIGFPVMYPIRDYRF